MYIFVITFASFFLYNLFNKLKIKTPDSLDKTIVKIFSAKFRKNKILF